MIGTGRPDDLYLARIAVFPLKVRRLGKGERRAIAELIGKIITVPFLAQVALGDRLIERLGEQKLYIVLILGMFGILQQDVLPVLQTNKAFRRLFVGLRTHYVSVGSEANDVLDIVLINGVVHIGGNRIARSERETKGAAVTRSIGAAKKIAISAVVRQKVAPLGEIRNALVHDVIGHIEGDGISTDVSRHVLRNKVFRHERDGGLSAAARYDVYGVASHAFVV